MTKIVLEQHGDTLQMTFPAETTSRLGLKAGQAMTLVETMDGLQLVPETNERDRQMRLAREVLAEQAEALRLLSQR